jgi:hypothetical protein
MSIVLLCFLYTGTAHAQVGVVVPVSADQFVGAITRQMILVLNILTWIMFVMLNYLLDPVFIFDLRADGAQGNLVEMMNQVWVLTRDLMNTGFALALIAAAVYTIATAKKDFVAQYAPKFLLAVVLVNFSWFFPRVIFDVANVAAAAVYGVPTMLQGKGSDCIYSVKGPDKPKNRTCTQDGDFFLCQCTQIVDVRFLVDKVQPYTDKGYECPMGRPVCYLERNLDAKNTAGYSAILNGLIMNHGRLGQLATVAQNSPSNGRDVDNFSIFLIRQSLVLLLHIAMFFPLAAMAFAFMVRIPVLWITMAFMPIIFADFVGASHFTEIPKKLWKYFLKACFLPAITGVPLTVGYILLNVGSNAGLERTLGQVDIRLWNSGADGAGITNVFQLLWLFMALAVIWTGVFAALMSGNDIFAKGAGFFKSAGENLGQAALKVPLSVRAIPGTNMTPLAMMRNFNPRALNAAVTEASRNPDGLRGYINDRNKGTVSSEPAKINDAAQKINADVTLRNRLDVLVKDAADSTRTDQRAKQQELIDELKKVGVDTNRANLARDLREIDRNLSTKLKNFDDETKKKKLEDELKKP